jgi:hypothetical protein
VEGNNGKYKKILLLPEGDHFFDNGTEHGPMRNCHFSVAQFELVMCTSLVSTCFVLYRSFDGLLEVGLSKMLWSLCLIFVVWKSEGTGLL